ncbi:MAG TPA: TIGR03621 family F420-dependent LLM class oxidoreductase [Acidimicrobiales bacterium]|nr:TIGR03621 family F420-dependent LLM class oxidoreductase [Acidimicrobiales bacterium]
MHPFRFGIQCKGPADPAGWPARARKVEDLGWSTLTVADHLDDPLAPVPAVVAAAAATTTLRVGTMVLANDYRHPAMVAKEAATVDVLSGGRFELGIGAGWMTTDYKAAGIPLERPAVRIDRLAEALAVLRGCWGDGPFDHHGEHYRITALDGQPQPHTPGGPPIVIGGGGERVLRLAAREADIVAVNVNLRAGVIDERAFPDGTPESTDRKLGWIRDAAGDRFPQLELQVRVHLAMVTDDRIGVIEQLAPAFGLTPDQAASTPHALVGTVDEICDQLVERRERWGISYLGLSHDQLDAFAPVVARLTGT